MNLCCISGLSRLRYREMSCCDLHTPKNRHIFIAIALHIKRDGAAQHNSNNLPQTPTTVIELLILLLGRDKIELEWNN